VKPQPAGTIPVPTPAKFELMKDTAFPAGSAQQKYTVPEELIGAPELASSKAARASISASLGDIGAMW
jgi:hypothetical protein